MKEKAKSKAELREEAVEVLYNSLKSNQPISKEECYEIYDKIQKKSSQSTKTD
ncbi:MAG: hypothetical protein AAFX57_10910 [Bacteroidota bacterium]